ncbi:uncharacterized protein LOC141729217 [Zonotrichia albicollis]|uniref:uncharacterized protein LOC141729217 n=1 Tax=Zonotrichia albicollis TaxID=44394 RepID=UPI003D80D7F9
MAAAGGAPLPGLSPVRGQSAGTAASARVTLSLPGHRVPRSAPCSAERGLGARSGANALGSAAAAGGGGRCPQGRKNHPTPPIFARSFGVWAAKGRRPQHQGSAPAHAVGGPGLAQGIVQVLTRAAALWSHFKGCPCWSTLVPAVPWDTEGALSQVALAPWQGCGSSPRAAGASREGTRGSLWDEAGESEQRSSSGWGKAKGPTWCHQGTCEEQNGHLEATWRKGMHICLQHTSRGTYL